MKKVELLRGEVDLNFRPKLDWLLPKGPGQRKDTKFFEFEFR